MLRYLVVEELDETAGIRTEYTAMPNYRRVHSTRPMQRYVPCIADSLRSESLRTLLPRFGFRVKRLFRSPRAVQATVRMKPLLPDSAPFVKRSVCAVRFVPSVAMVHL